MKRIYEKGFKWVPPAQTDLAKTFRRVRREQEEAAKAEAAPQVVRQLRKRS